MSPAIVLAGYCVSIVAVSLAGGWLPRAVRLTHRRLEIALSMVSGVMLGVALLHLLPDALVERGAWLHVQGTALRGDDGRLAAEMVEPVALWMLGGFLAMFLLERLFCFHHHDSPDGHGHEHDDCNKAHQSRPGPTWTGAAIGLTVHTLVAGAALAASVLSDDGATGGGLPGFATFLVIVLHKPFDSLTIGTLLVAAGSSRRTHVLVNGFFGLAVPAGVLIFALGVAADQATPHRMVSAALAFSAGTFLCIALSDLLPELQFHRHDRVKLTVALFLGLAIAWVTGG